MKSDQSQGSDAPIGICVGLVAISLVLFLVIAPAARAQDDAAEMARMLQDPLATISALMTDNDILFGTGSGDSTSYSFQIQPIYALDFPDAGFTFLPRGIIPISGVAPAADLPLLGDPASSGGSMTWGLGDIVTQFFFSPKTTASWKFGLGPQLSWKTRTNANLGGPGWGAGPSFVLVGNITEQFSFAGIVGNMWSYDGSFNTMLLQPMFFYNFRSIPGLWVGYNAAITADWKATSGNSWTVPVGLSVGKTWAAGGGHGFELLLGAYYHAVRPTGGADWSLKFGLNWVIPR